MSDEQDVVTPGWIDPRGGKRTEAGATAVVPGQRTEARQVEGQPTGPVDLAGPPGPVVPPGPPGPSGPSGPAVPPTEVGRPAVPPVPTAAGPEAPADPAGEPPAAAHPTTPVGFRPRPRMPRRVPLVRMGPWAPLAGAVVGLVLGLVVVGVLASAVDTFDQRLALVFVVLGLALLGAGGTLLADEVRLLRRGAQAAEARASGAGAIAGLLNGLTPARLLITASAFCLLLSAYVTSGT